jgi:Tfp pilus assembly protein PilF
VEWMQRAIDLAPEQSRFHAHLALFYSLGLNAYEKAAQEFRMAIKLNPNDAEILFNAASLCELPEKVVSLGECTGWLERAISLKPDDAHLYARQATILYRQADRVDDAQRMWVKALLTPQPLTLGHIQELMQQMDMYSE